MLAHGTPRVGSLNTGWVKRARLQSPPQIDSSANTSKLDCPLQTKSPQVNYSLLANMYFVPFVYSAPCSAPPMLKDCVVWGPSSGTECIDGHTKALNQTIVWVLHAAITRARSLHLSVSEFPQLHLEWPSWAQIRGDIQMPTSIQAGYGNEWSCLC